MYLDKNSFHHHAGDGNCSPHTTSSYTTRRQQVWEDRLLCFSQEPCFVGQPSTAKVYCLSTWKPFYLVTAAATEVFAC